jgi:uncharacterized protein (DUF427 family)
MARGQSLYHEYPGYQVALEQSSGHIRVKCRGTLVADSRRTLTVRETQHEPVVYFPIEDVRFEHLEKTDLETFCPFKGEASYWSIRTGSGLEENVVWRYEEPFDEVAPLSGYVSFYPDRVDWERS